MNIEDYNEQLKELCEHCRKCVKCKNHDKICLTKRMTFMIARKVYKKRVKKGLIQEDASS